MGVLAAAGIGMMVGGSVMGANSAKMAQKNLLAAANLPGVNLPARGAEALASQQSLLPTAQGIASGVNTFQNDQLRAILEGSMPGYGARQGQQGTDIMAMLRGEVPEDVQQLLKTNAAQGAVARGMPGSSVLSGSLSSNDWLKNLGLTSLGMMNTGMAANNAFTRATPYIAPMDVTAELGPTPTQADTLEAQRLGRQQALLAQEAVMPGQTASAGNSLSQIGGLLAGVGLGGGYSGPGSTTWTSGPSPSYGINGPYGFGGSLVGPNTGQTMDLINAPG